MPWFYVDDGFSDSRPVLNMPSRYRLAACGLWVLAGAWSAKEETDGFIPEAKLRDLGATPEVVRVLTSGVAPLWQRDDNAAAIERRRVGNATFLHWSKWQKTRAELVARREADVRRQRNHRRKGRDTLSSENREMSQRDSGVTNRDAEAPPAGECHSVTPLDVTRDVHARPRGPDPTRPEKTSSGYVQKSATDPNARDSIAATPGAELVRQLVPDEHPDAVRTMLRIKATELIHAGHPRDLVAQAIQLWLTKPSLGPNALPSLVSEVIKTRTSLTAAANLPATNGAHTLNTADLKAVGWQSLKGTE